MVAAAHPQIRFYTMVNPAKEASARDAELEGRDPISGIGARCPRAMTGPAAALPSPAMNSPRRLPSSRASG
jgi:hypothetical protein